MGRPSREPASSSTLAPALLRFARAAGLDVGFLADQAGLASSSAEEDDVAIGARATNDLMEAIARLLGEPFLALRLPADLPQRQYGLAELAARASTNVGDALVRFARYASLIHPELACEIAARHAEDADDAGESDDARWIQRSPAYPRGIGRHVHEYGLAYVLTQLRDGTGTAIAPRRAWFAHARPPDLSPLHAFFGTRALSFGEAESGLVFSRASLAIPMRGGDPRLAATADALADAALLTRPRDLLLRSRVAAKLETLLPDHATIDDVARALHMSARTLQRRLEDEGTRFSEVLDAVRAELARRLLGDAKLALSEIAFRLGFADLATFSRAFKRWTGKPPGTWRRRG